MTPFDWVHLVTDIAESGRRVERSATAAECAAVASELGLAACRRVDVRYQLRPLPGGRYRLEGRLGAEVEQACVVTLEPMPQIIDEALDVTFSPGAEIREDTSSEREILSEPDIEPLADGRIEAGRVVFELLASAIDPYPRRDGAEFAWSDPVVETPGAKSPFAALAKLKEKP